MSDFSQTQLAGAALPPFNPASEGAIPAATGDEPTYCYCQRVSYGDMIACDNPDCAIEWFHNVRSGILLIFCVCLLLRPDRN